MNLQTPGLPPLRPARGASLLACLLLMLALPVAALAAGTAHPDPGSRSGLPASSDALLDALDELRGAVESMNAPLSQAGSALAAWQAWKDANEALSELDRELDAGMSDDGEGPAIPSSCVEAEDAACTSCFDAAYGRVNFARMTLARLRSIHARTIQYIKAQQSFGDSVAPIHGMSGLAWQSSRAGIEESRKRFNANSMDKYNQLVGTMQSALQDVAECEATHFGNPDWYSRYGFMYLQAVKTAYEPVDGG